MTYQLCVIGNSHLGALKLGWDQLVASGNTRISGVTPVFFGAPRDGVRNVEAREGRLVPTTDAVKAHFLRMSGGRPDIDPACYDGFLLVGLGASMKRSLRLYRTHRWFGLRQTEDCPVISQGFAKAFLAEGYGGTRLASVAAMMAGLTSRPIFVTPEPYWAPVEPRAGQKTGDYGWARAVASGDGDRIAEMFKSAVTAALCQHATLIWQPDETVEHGIVTRARYNKGASKFISGDGDESDAAHMNADYGAAWWLGALDVIQPETAAAAPKFAKPARRRAG